MAGWAIVPGLRVEHGVQQRVRVVTAREVEGVLALEHAEDVAQGLHELPHAGHGIAPRHREAAGDVGLDLAVQAEREEAAAGRRQVPGLWNRA
jgi:hypothetical protein